MMRYGRSPALWAALLVAGCGGPGRHDLGRSVPVDGSFHAPPAGDLRPAAEALLRKEALTLEDVLQIAEAINPRLSFERSNIDLATAVLLDAGFHPNPSLVANVGDYRTGRGSFGDSKRVAGVSLPLALGGRIGAATTLAEKERDVTALNFVWRRREILTEVKHAFIAFLAARRTAVLSGEARDIAKRLHDLTNERFKARAIPEMELLKTAVHLATAETRLRQADAAVAIALKGLHAGMGDVDLPTERFTGELGTRFSLPGWEALRAQILAAHPLTEAARMERETAEVQLRLARAERIPDFEFQVQGGLGADGEGIVEGGVSIPLPVFNRNQGRVMAAEVRIRQAENRIRAARNDLVLRFTEVYRTFAAAQDRVTAYLEEILPKAERALEQTNEGHRLGKFGYLDVLDAQRTLGEARLSCVEALVDLNRGAAELEMLTGTRLEEIR